MPSMRAASCLTNVVCQGPCLWIGDHLDYCKPPAILQDQPSKLWTWVPEGSEWVYLIKVVGFTLAYVPESDTVYFVNPAYALRNACPPNTVVAAQCVRDEGGPPRLLVVDLLCERGVAARGMEPAARYARLQELQQHFVEPLCALQWCGERTALSDEFIGTLPHVVRARVGVGMTPGDFVMEEF